MYKFYGSKSVAKISFDNKRHTKIVIAKEVKKIAPLKNQIVVLGKDTKWDIRNWKVEPGYADLLAKELKKRRTVIEQDEFRTTIVCRYS